MAGNRGKAATLAEGSGFTERVWELLRSAAAVDADQTPARAAGEMAYVHLACAQYLTHMHTGDRSAPAIDAGGVLPGYGGIIVRDGCHAGYGHLTDALHAWRGAHLLRGLKDLYDFEPGKQDRAASMAGLLIEARDAASAARGAGPAVLDAAVPEDLVARYRELAASGLAANLYLGTATARDACRIARRFLKYEDMILRSATRPDLDIFTNNQAGPTIRPLKCSSAAPAAAGEPSRASRASRSSSPTCPPPPNGASANSTPSATCSTAEPGYHPASNPPDEVAPSRTTSRR